MRLGKFTTIGYIGGGNFGKVFKAKDELLEVERAIKIVQVQNPKEFVDAINEAKILEKCRHKNIVDIKEIDIFKDSNDNPVPCWILRFELCHPKRSNCATQNGSNCAIFYGLI